MIVAHRGASDDAPENTLDAFRLAWSQNADAIEGDFRLTKDEQIVCIHDEDTSRTCGEKLIVAENTYAELSKLDASAYFKGDLAPQSIPLLSDIFKTIPNNIYIHILDVLGGLRPPRPPQQVGLRPPLSRPPASPEKWILAGRYPTFRGGRRPT